MKICHFWSLLENIFGYAWKSPLLAPSEKNPPDTHVYHANASNVQQNGMCIYGLGFTLPISVSAGLRNLSHSINFTEFSHGLWLSVPRHYQRAIGYRLYNQHCSLRGGNGLRSTLGVPGRFHVCWLNTERQHRNHIKMSWQKHWKLLTKISNILVGDTTFPRQSFVLKYSEILFLFLNKQLGLTFLAAVKNIKHTLLFHENH